MCAIQLSSDTVKVMFLESESPLRISQGKYIPSEEPDMVVWEVLSSPIRANSNLAASLI